MDQLLHGLLPHARPRLLLRRPKDPATTSQAREASSVRRVTPTPVRHTHAKAAALVQAPLLPLPTTAATATVIK